MNRSRTVVVTTPVLDVRVVVTRSRSAPPCAPSSIRASDSSVRTAPAFSVACENCKSQLDTGQRLQRAHGARLFCGLRELNEPVATDEVVCVRVGGTNVGCYRLEGPGTYDLLPDDQIDGEWPNPADVIGVPLVDVTFDYVATPPGDLPRVVFWNLDGSADMARQMFDNLELAGYIPN